MTFSIAARCPETGMVGVALASSSICVASRCANVRAGVGAALSQNVTNPMLGPLALELMAAGQDGDTLRASLLAADPFIEWRQLVLAPLKGTPQVITGRHALGIFSAASGRDCAAGGNLLATPDLPQAMVDAFENSRGSLPERLLIALQAAVDVGGEAGPIHAAGIKATLHTEWPSVDLRIDWTEGAPIAELAALWQRYQPQMDAYVTRALAPQEAPSYGVAGDP
ncbi:DUF1028 domain-containing protein [Vogesella sp. LIG4]|uniref:DUF1028 domain-containing protein n=1 Tax=Vogesella sp. LIG4 TaxID=1192162 RepID=UPI00081F942C|nr:DUF1028 domain-containing protein [Vogesella sp. LIG4]SCK29482.1 Uncharacterized conserved protein, Ntn-hydrolase superfamily [Vogesella sp. LIG4]